MLGTKKVIPIVFAVDDNYVPSLGVTIQSILDNASKEYSYKIYVLNSGLTQNHIDMLNRFNDEDVSIRFVDVASKLNGIGNKLHLRDYYTKTIYYRLFIPSLFPQYQKALYLDSDLVVIDDVSKLYNVELGDKYVGAIQEEVMACINVFGNYVEQGLDIPCKDYFNSGVMVMNLDKLREIEIEDKFVELLNTFKFEVTPDQDYLNIICKNNSVLLDLGWNKTPMRNDNFDDKDLKIIHYKLAYKPWFYDDVMYGDYFWHYARKTVFFDEIVKLKTSYTETDKKRDFADYLKLMRMAKDYVASNDSYKSIMQRGVLCKIAGGQA